MKLTYEGIKDRASWEAAGISLPSYDAQAVSKAAVEAPRWAHFGIGNIFRVFIGGIADRLLEEGALDRGLTCVETFDFDVVDRIYRPYDNLGISVILRSDGTVGKRVLGSMAEAVNASAQRGRLTEIFTAPSLQMISFTITEKGYALNGTDGGYLPFVARELEAGPESATHAMTVVTAGLLARFKSNAAPLSLVSMDNCSKNGDLLRRSVMTVAREWRARGFCDDAFVDYVSDETRVAFPWTMIDKITPRPSDKIADMLEADGVESMRPVITGKRTYIAPFINAEGPQYLVIEDNFPNGRPELEKAGVYMTDRETVNKSERMKVTVCLNPIHTALGPMGVVLGYDLFSDEMRDPTMFELGRRVGYDEGMPVVPDPVILSPKAFIDECMYDRFPNPYLGDTCLRLATDASQGLGVRFGVTINSYVERDGSAACLTAIPIAIAGWVRYMMGVDDKGEPYELAPDPLNGEMTQLLSDVRLGEPDSLRDQLKPFLSNKALLFADMYEAGIGEKIEGIVREMIAGPGAVRATLEKYLK